MAADAQTAQELQRLARLIEESGLADRRPALRALLAAADAAHHRPTGPRPLVRGGAPLPPSAAKRGAKAAVLLRGALDAALVLGLLWLALGLWRGDDAWQVLLWVLAPLAAACLVPRFLPLRDAAHEALFRLVDEATFAWDWLAEAFNTPAVHRIARRQAARDVMSAWRRHRRALSPGPGLDAVAAFLDQAFGAAAARAFRSAVAARIGAGDDRGLGRGAAVTDRHAARRLVALRWSALIRLFETVACSGAFWPRPAPANRGQPPREPVPEEIPAPEDAEAEERRRQGIALREDLRRKRQNLSESYTWNVKTPGEVAQRDLHAEGLRAEIAALEQRLEPLKA